MIKTIVAGSRNFDDYELLKYYLDKALKKGLELEIVSGTAKGADKLGERYAEENDLPLKKFPAKWDELGKKAGYVRNEEMAQYADACIVFWDGSSKGTKHMIDLAEKYELTLKIVYF